MGGVLEPESRFTGGRLVLSRIQITQRTDNIETVVCDPTKDNTLMIGVQGVKRLGQGEVTGKNYFKGWGWIGDWMGIKKRGDNILQF